MPEPIYRDVLTDESARALGGLLHDLPSPVALAGGHAVRLRVAAAWRARFQTDYFGSRDIDVCYEVKANWAEGEFARSAAAQAPKRLRELGFQPSGMFRFVRFVDENGQFLAREPPSPKQLGTDYHGLFLDPMVSSVHPLAKQVLGFVPVDEPVLQSVFDDPQRRTDLPMFGPKVYLPVAGALVATKLKSLPSRARDDKMIKDLCDLYALMQYGGQTLVDIREIVHGILPDARELAARARSHKEVAVAVRHLGIGVNDFRAVVGTLEVRPK